MERLRVHEAEFAQVVTFPAWCSVDPAQAVGGAVGDLFDNLIPIDLVAPPDDAFASLGGLLLIDEDVVDTRHFRVVIAQRWFIAAIAAEGDAVGMVEPDSPLMEFDLIADPGLGPLAILSVNEAEALVLSPVGEDHSAILGDVGHFFVFSSLDRFGQEVFDAHVLVSADQTTNIFQHVEELFLDRDVLVVCAVGGKGIAHTTLKRVETWDIIGIEHDHSSVVCYSQALRPLPILYSLGHGFARGV